VEGTATFTVLLARREYMSWNGQYVRLSPPRTLIRVKLGFGRQNGRQGNEK